jgi:positive regulator of sigma E activity
MIETDKFEDHDMKSIVHKAAKKNPNENFENDIMAKLRNEENPDANIEIQLSASFYYFSSATLFLTALVMMVIFGSIFSQPYFKAVAAIIFLITGIFCVSNIFRYYRFTKSYAAHRLHFS